jgi:hypothetical protein
MSELQQYYDAFRTGYWMKHDPEACPCRGNGWALSEVDTWHKCPTHYSGQPHPEDESDDLMAAEFVASGGTFAPDAYAPPVPPLAEAPVAPLGDDDIPF